MGRARAWGTKGTKDTKGIRVIKVIKVTKGKDIKGTKVQMAPVNAGNAIVPVTHKQEYTSMENRPQLRLGVLLHLEITPEQYNK